MEPVIIAALIGIAVYLAFIALIPKRILMDSTKYTRSMLQRLAREKPGDEVESNLSVLRQQTQAAGFLARVFFTLPGTTRIYPKLMRAGLTTHITPFFLACLAIFAATLYLLRSQGAISLLIALAAAYLFGICVIQWRINKRNAAFLNAFPDALDMIVRSVRSGYPLNSAVRMVADNMQPPVSSEFKQVADEVAYGSTLIEALQRLSYRIDEQDVRFFVVVLTVQQDVGGNLSEVLNNLSSIIRKRKHLRMKIKALSSEGRATAWVLGSMPLAEAIIVSLAAPSHLTPLFTTPLGNIVLTATISVVVLGIVIVWRMVNIKV